MSELPRYLARLTGDLRQSRELAQRHELVLPERVDTIYLGGGTPSILSSAQMQGLFDEVRSQFAVDSDAEITIEAAPAMLDDDLLTTAVNLGVTRISFGVQTFVDAEARATGRLHTTAQALEDITRARQAGLAVSIDLIAGLPGQTEASWRHSLATLGEAAPKHASIYMLEVDEDSRLGKEMLLGGVRYGAGLTTSEDAVADFYAEACRALAGYGLEQYEISNFARAGCESRHNMRYWQRRPYLGVGLDAHSMLHSLAPDRGPVRFGTGDELTQYLNVRAETTEAWGELHRLSADEALEEAWFLGLRCNAGVRLEALQSEFGRARIARYDPILDELASDGLIQVEGGRVALTNRGRMLSNDVFARFLGVADDLNQYEQPELLAASAR